MPTAYAVSSTKHIVALSCLGIAGNMAPFILPLIVGGLVDHLGLSVGQASFAASADMFGLGAGALLWSKLILTASLRKFALLAAAFLFLGNVASAFSDTFQLIFLSRFVSGLGGGLMLSIGVTGLSKTHDPDRVVAIYMLVVTATASALLFVLPFVLKNSGASAMFLTLAGFASLAGLSSLALPDHSLTTVSADGQNRTRTAVSKQVSDTPLITRLLGVGGVLTVFFSLSLYWVYIERAGVSVGFTTEQISAGLGSAQFTGVAGALTAAIVSTRLGNRMLPVMFCVVVSLLATLTVPLVTEFAYYAVSAAAVIFCWNMIYPYLVGLVGALDSSARLVSYALVMMTLGKSLSPIVGAVFVTETDFSGAYWLAAAVFVLSAVILLSPLRYSDRRLKSTIFSTVVESGTIKATITKENWR